MNLVFRRAICTSINLARRTMPIPDRWDAYQPLGSVIPGTKFIAFKVPLKEELLQQVKEKDKFSPTILMKLLGDQGIKLGGIIDLTFTFKYYNREEFQKHSVGHKKIFTPGHAVPSESVFQEFAHAVKAFDADDKGIIGVHCTHGVNRTGYLICRYMIEEMDYEPDDAISLFGEARGHRLERDNYLEDLRSRKRGQSLFDPNFKVQPEDRMIFVKEHQNPRRQKPRWRHHKADHPEWRRSYHHSTQASDSSHSSSREITGDIRQRNLHSHHRNSWNYEDTHNGYFVNRDHPVGSLVHEQSDRCVQGSSNPDWRNNSSRYNSPYEDFDPNQAGKGHKHSYGNRFGTINDYWYCPYDHRVPHANTGRTRRGGYRPHNKNFD